MRKFYRKSEAEAIGERVTYRSKYGGTGLGRLIGGQLFVSGGNGFYYPQPHEVIRDGGEGYRRAVRGLALPPAYKI